ncbi:PPOX class F420-dependent oxidoreductase [Nakamurella sp. GG22]
MTTPLDVLGDAQYALLTTFRKDGTGVPTPVWVVRIGDELRVWTIRDSGKVKRIRRTGRVQIAPCTVRGNPRGKPVDATARMLPHSEAPAVLGALAAKYGLMGWWTKLMNRFTGDTRAVIGVTIP